MPTLQLRTQHPQGLVVGGDPLRVSWRYTPEGGDTRQVAYQIETSDTSSFERILSITGEVLSSDQIGLTVPGYALTSRETRYVRARIATESGWKKWSEPSEVETGLLEPDDWAAKAIALPEDPGAHRQSPCPLLRREFDISGDVVRARLHVTALGVYQILINGQPASDEFLNPGWSSYRQRLLAATFDVTNHLRRGGNVIAAILGDGWYRGRLGWNPNGDRCHYGSELGLIAQLEIETLEGRSITICSDETWATSTGEFLSADLYDGSTIDLRQRQNGWDLPGFDDSSWKKAKTVPFDASSIAPRIAAPVRVVARMVPEAIGDWGRTMVLDGGQNLSGFVSLQVQGKPGDVVRVRHAEVLESDGTLHTRSLRSAKATDTYILGQDGRSVLEPIFTFHGFRYAEIESEADILSCEFVALSSDLTPRSTFECSDESLNRLHENVVWSQRGNFVSIPTDCPQRDERLGWTGDAQAFAATSCTLFDAQGFWASWLTDLALDQNDSLGVSTVVPDVVISGEPRYGRAGWADAATIVPWAVYESYGDPAVIHRQFESMRSWVDSLKARRDETGLLAPSMQFGDWLDPDAPPDRPWEAKADATFLANAFFAYSARLVADAARVMGLPNVHAEYRALTEELASLTWKRWEQHILETQTGCAAALQFDLVPLDQQSRVGSQLAKLVREAGGGVSSGFLGTPLVLPALTATGHHDEAFLMLLRREYPSWLYQVEQGATTVWERWDAIRSDGSIHPGTMAPPPDMEGAEEGHMLSFNHYAYGAVIDWVYRNVAGLAPSISEPGYRRIVFAPKPSVGIGWARASVDSGLGRVAISWKLDDGVLHADIEIPFGAEGTFIAPASSHSSIMVDGALTGVPIHLAPGAHSIRVTAPEIANPGRASVDD